MQRRVYRKIDFGRKNESKDDSEVLCLLANDGSYGSSPGDRLSEIRAKRRAAEFSLAEDAYL